ncbi:hypothetical protein [Helicobacter rodentium]|nr:hypothetical protein [Helicobacter rodentium]
MLIIARKRSGETIHNLIHRNFHNGIPKGKISHYELQINPTST